MNISHVEIWTFGITDFIPTYVKLLASKPDAIMAMVSGQAQYQLMAARQLGFKGPFFSNSPLGPDVFVRVAGPQVCTDVFCNGLNPDEPTPAMKEVIDRWQKKYKEPFVSDSIIAWDAGWILAQAIRKAQSVDPKEVVTVLHAMSNKGDLQTSFGPGYMGGKSRFGVNAVLIRPMPISHITNGKIKLIGYRYGSNR
jgi:ABC-type branched-subunit amino acid transport system substrate-binding protein